MLIPWSKFIPYLCIVMILYLNFRKHGRLMEYSEWLSYLIIILGIFSEIIINNEWHNYEILGPYFNFLLIAYIGLNKTAKSFQKEVRKWLGVWRFVLFFVLIAIIFSINLKYAPVVYMVIVLSYILILVVYRIIVLLNE